MNIRIVTAIAASAAAVLITWVLAYGRKEGRDEHRQD